MTIRQRVVSYVPPQIIQDGVPSGLGVVHTDVAPFRARVRLLLRLLAGLADRRKQITLTGVGSYLHLGCVLEACPGAVTQRAQG
jgi:hypothetical protein